MTPPGEKALAAELVRVVEHVTECLGERDTWVLYPGGWPGEIEVALLDAIFSANARYGRPRAPGRGPTGVFKVIENWRTERGTEPLDDLSAMIEVADSIGPEHMPDLLGNRQFVPGGRLRKGVAIYEAAKGLRDVGVEHAADLADSATQTNAAAAYSAVPGLGWVTFDYFLSLLEHPNVKADRMIVRFVEGALARAVNEKAARRLVLAAAGRMAVDPRTLDHAIWDYQRRQPNTANTRPG